MATLVLSTVGSALGGPVGGAIGALIGQSFDQQLLSPAKRGPRLGDLSVQTSSYGTQIPRVYGTMRVAGSVVWATDLIEGAETGGAKGEPDVAYSYSVSMAVALSSRPVSAIKRIWADGKLLRGADGDFKIGTTFRFYDGSEDQVIDPLIGSIEGIAGTPSYRGLALAVFEQLDLAEFGNRIPFLTFEVVADEASPTISTIFSDASLGAIQSDADEALLGYAAYGTSIRAALQPLLDCYDVALFDDGAVVRGGDAGAVSIIGDDEVGNAADGQTSPSMQREQIPARSLPATLRISYYDPLRDFQTAEARASSGEQFGNEMRQELPAVLDAMRAKSLVQQMLARQWTARDKLTLRLAPDRIGLEPGALIQLSSGSTLWVVDKCTVDGFVLLAELRPVWRPAGMIAADPGRIASNPDIVAGPLSLALFDLPRITATSANQPAALMAASRPTAGWSNRTIDLTGPLSAITQTPVAKSVLGHAITMLGGADPELIDGVNFVEVELVDTEQWLTSCDDDALGAGTNLAVLGSELLQFGNVETLGNGRFRLSRLLRGRWGTEWAIPAHLIQEHFCLIQANALREVLLPAWAIGATLGAADRHGANTSMLVTGEAVRPWSPANLVVVQNSGDLSLSWNRRSRASPFWLDEVDVPIGESREQYQVIIAGPLGSAEFSCEGPAVTIAAADVAALGPGPAQIEVRQIGDFAASRAAQLTLTLS